MMEQRTYRKTLKFYQKLLQKEKRSKGRAECSGRAGGGGGARAQGLAALTVPRPQAPR